MYRTTGIEGSITINGKERNISQFRKLSAYIMQDNQLHGNLTVDEAMNVASSLKLPQSVAKTEKDVAVRIFIFLYDYTAKHGKSKFKTIESPLGAFK